MENMKFFRCPVCGNIIFYVKNSSIPVHCCGMPMEEIVPNTVDASKEKHVPVVEQFNSSIMVSIGTEAHPMIQSHYIEWIALQTVTGIQIHYLKPEEPPCYEFQMQESVQPVAVFAYCNLHGLWKASVG
ncbi:MAG: hypothetical protein MJZ26_07800 [Fibrobacter sp.]|nr:hypothetical protein [Fibrobacter sp.]